MNFRSLSSVRRNFWAWSVEFQVNPSPTGYMLTFPRFSSLIWDTFNRFPLNDRFFFKTFARSIWVLSNWPTSLETCSSTIITLRYSFIDVGRLYRARMLVGAWISTGHSSNSTEFILWLAADSPPFIELIMSWQTLNGELAWKSATKDAI